MASPTSILGKLAGLAGKAKTWGTPHIKGAASKIAGYRPTVGGVVEGMTGIGKGLPGRWKGASPLMKTMVGLDVLGGGAFLGSMGLDLGKGLIDEARTLGKGPFRARVDAEYGSKAYTMGLRMEGERRAREIAANAQRLAQINPNLYSQLMTGRTLPRGHIVIGGQPRTDLLEDFARQMAEDARNQRPASAEEEYLKLLGS